MDATYESEAGVSLAANDRARRMNCSGRYGCSRLETIAFWVSDRLALRYSLLDGAVLKITTTARNVSDSNIL
jgi:hypothetical protein